MEGMDWILGIHNQHPELGEHQMEGSSRITHFLCRVLWLEGWELVVTEWTL